MIYLRKESNAFDLTLPSFLHLKTSLLRVEQLDEKHPVKPLNW